MTTKASEYELSRLIGIPMGRINPVSAAYDGMNEDNRRAFRTIIQDAHSYPHVQVAKALRELGYEIDRKQVQNFREKLALGKVIL
jgi:hypothetical protein